MRSPIQPEKDRILEYPEPETSRHSSNKSGAHFNLAYPELPYHSGGPRRRPLASPVSRKTRIGEEGLPSRGGPTSPTLLAESDARIRRLARFPPCRQFARDCRRVAHGHQSPRNAQISPCRRSQEECVGAPRFSSMNHLRAKGTNHILCGIASDGVSVQVTCLRR